MPFAFLIVGVVLVISGVRGTSQDLLTLVKGDFIGKGSYLYWLIAILLIGSIGYIPSFKGFSKAFMTLILVVLVLKEGNPNGSGGGFFKQFQNSLTQISQGNGA